jgi:L-amino acid N-acyltransferase YncA
MPASIEPLQEADWPAVRAIYLQGIATGNATFEQEAPDWEKWDSGKLRVCRLIARLDGEIAGWAALGPVSSRPVYRGVAEVSVYVASKFRGEGVGRDLLARLIVESEAAGLWTLQAGIFPENTASIRLHQSLGFRIVGTRERLGEMSGVWRDVVLMERRSAVVGRLPSSV